MPAKNSNVNSKGANNGGNAPAFAGAKSGGKQFNGGKQGGNNNSNGGNFTVGGKRSPTANVIINDNGINALIYARHFTSRSGQPMVKLLIYDFAALKKYSAAVPLSLLVKTAYPSLNIQSLTELGNLTPQQPTQ
jgi:hypothetical protein